MAMPLERDVRAWLVGHIMKDRLFTFSERQALVDIIGRWDQGALRTIHCYYSGLGKSDLNQFLYMYYGSYYCEDQFVWKLYNPSAAAVALCRKLIPSSKFEEYYG